MISILKIEIDGHFHGGAPVKPWVAEITGPDPKWGLARRFLDPMNDWSQASVAMSGNVYGRTANFALREGKLYEVQRCRGKPSKRHVIREFVVVVGGKRERIDAEDALARADGGGDATRYQMAEDQDGTSWVARVRGLGTPERLGFVVVNERRVYRLRPGLYEVSLRGARRLVIADAESTAVVTQREAWEWLSAKENGNV